MPAETPSRGILPAAAAIVAAALLLFGCGGGDNAQAGGRGGKRGNPGSDVVAVTVVRASRGSISKTLDAGGEVVAENQVDAFADIAGKVTAVLIDVGDTVRKGQRIASVDPSTPGKEFSESPVVAPISGTVTALPVSVGDKISSTMQVASIGRLDALDIEVHVPERFIGQVRLGTQAVCSFAAWPGEEFPAHVIELSPVVDSTTRTLKTKLALDDPDGRVKAGMYAKVELVLQKKAGVLTLPVDCVVSRDGNGRKEVLFVVAGDKAFQRTVEVGLSTADSVEITSGIGEGEQVVASGQSLLSDGSMIRIVENGHSGNRK
jgi:membrane fusion protein (multidrug efflux system)